LFSGLVGAAIARQQELRFPIDEAALRRQRSEEELVPSNGQPVES
jgi:CTP synthase